MAFISVPPRLLLAPSRPPRILAATIAISRMGSGFILSGREVSQVHQAVFKRAGGYKTARVHDSYHEHEKLYRLKHMQVFCGAVHGL